MGALIRSQTLTRIVAGTGNIGLFAASGQLHLWTLLAEGQTIMPGRGRGGAPMQIYEIRVLNDDHTTRTIVAQQYINDGAAIRSAQRYAEPHDCEVWRGLTCVWHSAREAAQ